MNDFDLVVIGGGNGGLSAAHPVARAGKNVALVDRGPIGGLCSLAGCNPKKVLVRASEILQEVGDSGEHGIRGEWSIEWRRVWERKKRFTDPVTAASEKSLAASGVELIRGEARFLSPTELRAGNRTLRASGFVIATGSSPRRLDFPGAEFLKISDEVLELQAPPERMVILGAGVVAFEFAQVFARVGTRVTMAMRASRALANFDADFVAPLIKHSEKLGIEFLTHTEVEKIERSGDEYRLHFTRGGVREADFVLNATGRAPALEALNLAAAEVEVDRTGVVVDDYLRSRTNRRVFAAGDAHGRWQLSPVASYEGRTIARNFLESDVQRVDYSAIPHVVFTVPPLAAVGMTEEQAVAAGRDVVVKKSEMTQWKTFAIAGSHLAHARVILDRSSEEILGAQLLGEGAAENIHLFALAMQQKLPAPALRSLVYAYPTFASAIPSLL